MLYDRETIVIKPLRYLLNKKDWLRIVRTVRMVRMVLRWFRLVK